MTSTYLRVSVLLSLFLLLFVPAAEGKAADSVADVREDTSETTTAVPSDGEYRSRLLFTSTAEMMRPGRIEVSVVSIALPQAAVGIAPSLSVEAGLSVAPGWIGKVFLLNPKVQVWSQGRWSLALEARTVLAERDAGFLGSREPVWEIGAVPQMIGTVNLPQTSLTLGVGVPWNTMGFSLKDPGDAFGNEADVRITAGADLEVTPWLKLLTENYLYVGVVSKEVASSDFLSSTEGEAVVESLNGARFQKAGLAFDVALGVDTRGALFSTGTELFPYLRLSYQF